MSVREKWSGLRETTSLTSPSRTIPVKQTWTEMEKSHTGLHPMNKISSKSKQPLLNQCSAVNSRATESYQAVNMPVNSIIQTKTSVFLKKLRTNEKRYNFPNFVNVEGNHFKYILMIMCTEYML